MQSDHHCELMKLEVKHQSGLNRKEAAHTEETARLRKRISWQNLIIGSLRFLLLKTGDIFRKVVNGIIRLAGEYCKPRFDAEPVSDIKSALNLFGDDRQSHQVAGDFLYISQPRRKASWITGDKSKPDGKSITWWKGIMTNSRKEYFR